MEQKQNKFIVVSDKDTAAELKKLGFSLIQENNNMYTFLNVGNRLAFSNHIDKKKIAYTNKLTF